VNPRFALLFLAGIASAAPGIDIEGDDIYPESITSTADGTVIVGSAKRTIYRALAGATVAVPWIELEAASPRSVFGVFADERAGVLWGCTATYGPSETIPPRSALYGFDLATGAQKHRYPLPTEGALCNDIAVGRDGSVYATDTDNMEIVRLAPGSERLETWVGGGAFGPKGDVLDGIAVLGDRVIVNTLATGKLFAVRIGKSGSAQRVRPILLARPIEKPDGMRAIGRSTLLLAENVARGRVTRVRIRGDRARLSAVAENLPRGAVAVTASGNKIWVLERQPTETNGRQRRVRAEPMLLE
jgi:hypothetical protein